MLLMVDSLKSFRLEKVQRAFEYIRLHPQPGYKGMPSETEVIAVINQLGEQDSAEAEREKSRQFQEEMRDLQRRKDSGEKFYGWADLLQWGKENLGIDVLEKTKMPEAPKPEPITEDDWEAGRKRREQLLADFRRANPDAKI